jgi:ANTAR domain
VGNRGERPDAGRHYVRDGSVAEQLAELQLTLGEGPGQAAHGRPRPCWSPTWRLTSPAGGGRRSRRASPDRRGCRFCVPADDRSDPGRGDGPVPAEQLQAALNSRIIIEQAKGKLAERFNLAMDQAFALLRDHARETNQRLTDTARNLVDSATADFPPQPGGWDRP